MPTLTYIDANVIINALEGQSSASVQAAFDVLTDSNRVLLVSEFLLLEVLPKRICYQMDEQVEFINEIVSQAKIAQFDKEVLAKSWELACAYGLGAMDALHVASAIRGQAAEMVSFEKPSKPMFKIPASEIIIFSLHPTAQ